MSNPNILTIGHQCTLLVSIRSVNAFISAALTTKFMRLVLSGLDS